MKEGFFEKVTGKPTWACREAGTCQEEEVTQT